MKLAKSLMMLGLGAALFAACKKDETTPNNGGNNGGGNNTPAKTKKELLVDGKWQIAAMVETVSYGGVDTSYDYYAEMEDCSKDNFLTFTADGNGTADEGATKCDPSDDQTTPVKWSLIENDTKFVTEEDGYKDTMDVAELTASQLKLKSSGTESGMNWSTTITLKNIK